MDHLTIKDEAKQRNVSTYQVKKERTEFELNRMKNRINELERINVILVAENTHLRHNSELLIAENNLLKLEQQNINTFIPIVDILDGISNQSEVMTQAEYDASIPTNFVRLSYS
jgi:hypothetical protein